MKDPDKHYNNFNPVWKVPWKGHLGRNQDSWTPLTHIGGADRKFGKVGLYTRRARVANRAVALCAQWLCGQIPLPRVRADIWAQACLVFDI